MMQTCMRRSSKMKQLIIYGAGGFAREVAWLVERINKVNPEWNILGYIDDNQDNHGMIINGYPILGGADYLDQFENIAVTIAVGKSITREKIVLKLLDKKQLYFPNLIDPSVIFSQEIKFGHGAIICANTVLTTNIEIGNFPIINLNCTVGHDVVIEDYVTLLPSVNISGNSLLQKCSDLGTQTIVIPQKTVGAYSIIGAGAVVTKDIPKNCTAVGIPANPIKFHKSE